MERGGEGKQEVSAILAADKAIDGVILLPLKKKAHKLGLFVST